MNKENLEALLREITLSAIVKNSDGEDKTSAVLFEIDAAVKSRRTVDCVQFEEAWRDVLDDSKQPYLFINFKLSSDVCAVAYEEGKEVNELTWNLVLPFINGIEAYELPESSFDWLEKGEIHIGNESIEAFDCLNDLIQMDES